jgi:anaerobic ribonucleoside-triphosphate reductase
MSKKEKECLEVLEPVHCHDCGKELKTGDEMVVYDLGEKGTFYKCEECFAQKEELDNYQNCEVYSRVVGYIRPVDQWNVGKAEEYKDRLEFDPEKSGENGKSC